MNAESFKASPSLSELFSQLKYQIDLCETGQSRKLLRLCYLGNISRVLFAPAGGEVVFLERQEGESVLLHCALEGRDLLPFGAYLKRTWLRPGEVLFKHTETEFSVAKDGDETRISVSGDPSTLRLNITISLLRVGDTDRYSCEFVLENYLRLPGTTEFFLLVTAGEFSFLSSGVDFLKRHRSGKGSETTVEQKKVIDARKCMTTGLNETHLEGLLRLCFCFLIKSQLLHFLQNLSLWSAGLFFFFCSTARKVVKMSSSLLPSFFSAFQVMLEGRRRWIWSKRASEAPLRSPVPFPTSGAGPWRGWF